MPAHVPVAVRLAQSFRREGDCRVWTGARRPDGYGLVSDRCRTRRVHVAAWEAAHGPVPEGVCVLHRCDNRACFEVTHLFLGSRRDNHADMMQKGREIVHPENLVPGYHGPRGEAHHKAKLTADDVAEIRRLAGAVPQRELARRYGVTQSSVWAAVTGRTWQGVVQP
jgi:DNA-binding transcriptional regulator YiaG